MDYVTRQFITLTKKFHKELRDALLTSHKDSEELVDAIRDQVKTNREQSDASKKLYQSPLRVDIETWQEEDAKSKKDSQRKFGVSIQFAIALGTCGAFIAASIYAGITNRQLKTAQNAIATSKQSSDRQLAKLTEEIGKLETANKISFDANRPWVGITPRAPGEKDRTEFEFVEGDYERVLYYWDIKNAGRRPANLDKIEEGAEWSSHECTDYPRLNYHGGEGTKAQFLPKGGKAFLLPDVTIHSALQRFVPKKEWDLVVNWTHSYCIYAAITYTDPAEPSVVHHTRDCKVLVVPPATFNSGVPSGWVQCDNNFIGAD